MHHNLPRSAIKAARGESDRVCRRRTSASATSARLRRRTALVRASAAARHPEPAESPMVGLRRRRLPVGRMLGWRCRDRASRTCCSENRRRRPRAVRCSNWSGRLVRRPEVCAAKLEPVQARGGSIRLDRRRRGSAIGIPCSLSAARNRAPSRAAPSRAAPSRGESVRNPVRSIGRDRIAHRRATESVIPYFRR